MTLTLYRDDSTAQVTYENVKMFAVQKNTLVALRSRCDGRWAMTQTDDAAPPQKRDNK